MHGRARLLFLILLFFQTAQVEAVWQTLNSGMDDVDIHSIAVSALNAQVICAASRTCVYFSQNQGNAWRKIFSFKAESGEINFVYLDPVNPDAIYLATSRGVYLTQDRGDKWQKIFSRPNELANEVNWITRDYSNNGNIYLATAYGLYASGDSGAGWSRISNGLPAAETRVIAPAPDNSRVLYLANDYGLYKSEDSGQSWRRIYLTSFRASAEDEPEDETDVATDSQNLITGIALNGAGSETVFIATGAGVYTSLDAGRSWQKLSSSGLSCDSVNQILLIDGSVSSLHAACDSGVFQFLSQQDRWVQLYQGLGATKARSLVADAQGKQLFAATNRGVFKTEPEPDGWSAQGEQINRLLIELAQGEPGIRQVQEAALRYAEVVHPERINALRRNARLSSLLPDLSLNYDKTIYGTAGTNSYDPRAFVGPRDWGLSLTWDMGDLVFNEQLRLIDSNVRLMVQLRDDILNEITRLYYERLRLKSELRLYPLSNEQESLEKVLRLEELTANIDALSGGYFSSSLER